jgi:hypothetical protein
MSVELKKIASAIAALYNAAAVKPPSPESCITPLRDLVGSLNLNCVELPKLTSRVAADFLLQRNVTVISASLNLVPLAGYLHVSPNFGCIFVNQDDRVTRRRFSIAHELGHYLLHFRPLLAELKTRGELLTVSVSDSFEVGDGQSAESDGSADRASGGAVSFSDPSIVAGLLPPLEQMEDEADAFALELLMPADVVHAQAARLALPKDDLAWKLAAEMLVSRSTMYRRLEELQL